MEKLEVICFVRIAAQLPPSHLQVLALVSRGFLAFVNQIKNNNVYWCLQYAYLGYCISYIHELIIDAIGFYSFLDKHNHPGPCRNSDASVVYERTMLPLPKHSNHLHLVLRYFREYLDVTTLQQQQDLAIKNGDLKVLKALNTQLTTEKFVATIGDGTTSSGHCSIVTHFRLIFCVDQLITLGSEDLVLFLIDNDHVSDLTQHNELFGKFVHHAAIIKALLYQGLDPRYNNHILVAAISDPVVYRIFRDDGRLMLNARDEILIERLRDHTEIVCELLRDGFTLTEALLRHFLTSKCDDLEKILPYADSGTSIIELSRDILDQGRIRYHGHDYITFEEFSRDISQDDAVITLLEEEDVLGFQHVLDEIHPIRRTIHRCPGIFLFLVTTIISQLLALASIGAMIGAFFENSSDVSGAVASLSVTVFMLILVIIGAVVRGILHCYYGSDSMEKFTAWLGMDLCTFVLVLGFSIFANIIIAIILAVVLPLHYYGRI